MQLRYRASFRPYILRRKWSSVDDEAGQRVDRTPKGHSALKVGYDGYVYSLDLCAKHAEDFHDTIQGLMNISAERERVAGQPRRLRSSATASPAPSSAEPRVPARRDREQIQAIRDWANAHGFSVSNRGRIPAEVEQAFHDAFMKPGA
jgi:hypothetical protein